jgi:peptide/nickel transport system substrate-binding protein
VVTHRRTVTLLATLTTLFLTAALGAGGAASASSTPSPSPGASSGKLTFTVGQTQDVDSLNPFTGITAASYEIWQVMYDTLVSYSPKDFSPTPWLATRWTTSADGLTWTYTIRSGVKWSDGVPLTASDVAYTYNRIIKGSYEQTNWGSYTKDITSVTAPDATTVVMKTKTPSPIMTRLYVPILPAHVWSKISESQVKSYKNEGGAVGSGMFDLVKRQPGQYIQLEANKGWWGGAPKVDTLVYKIYNNTDAMAQALKKGEVDFVDALDAGVWTSLENTPGITTVKGAYYGFNELAFNNGAALADGTRIGNGAPALKDKQFRVALNHAVDRNAIVKRVLDGTGSVGTTFIPPIFAELHYEPANPYTFDLAKAGQLLDAAGYTKGASGVRIDRTTKKPLKLRLFARTNSQNSQQASRLIQGWFKQLGVPVNLSVISEDTLTERIGQGDYDMFEWGWLPDPNGDYQLSTFTCDKRSYKDRGQIYANLSDSFYCNPEYDKLYALQAKQVDPAQRAATVKQMQKMIYDDAAYAVLYNYDDLEAYNSKWTGFVPQPTNGGVLLYQYGAWSYPHIQLASTGTGTNSSTGSGISTGAVVAAVVVGAALLGGGAFLIARRRRGNAMDVE